MKKILPWTNLLLLFVLPLIFYPNIEEVFVLPKRLILYLGVILLLAGILFSPGAGLSLNQKNTKNKYDLLLLLFAFLVIFAFVVSGHYSAGLNEILDWVPLLILGFIWKNYLDYETAQKGTCLLISAATLTSIYAFCQKLGIDPVNWEQIELVKTRSIGTLGNPDFLSSFLVTVFPLALAALFLFNERKHHLLLSFSVILIGAGSVLSFSRGGWIALIIGTVCFLWLSRFKLEKKQVWGFILIVCLAFLLIKFGDRHKEISLSSRMKNFINLQDPSISSRIHLWKTAIILSMHSPILGHGPGTFPYLALPYRESEPLFQKERLAIPEKVHNDLLEIMISFGTPALLLYLLILGYSLAKVYNKIQVEPHNKIFWAGIAGSLIAFIVQGLFVYSTLPVLVIFWFLLSAINFREGDNPKKLPALAAFIIIILGLGLTGGNLVADHFFYRALTENLAGNQTKAIQEINQAIKIYPLQPAYYINKGKFLEAHLRNNYSPLCFSSAANAYIRASKINPLNPYPFADLGRLAGTYAAMGQPMQEIAIWAYQQALERDPYNAFFLNDIGNVYLDSNRPAQAIIYYQKSLRIHPNSSLTLANWGRALLLTGQKEQALEIIQKALRIDPHYQYAKQLLHYIGKDSK